ncbi:putative ABC transporter [Leptomonas pyrrhocoris]|uniref:Putative ABC transporter n=1 Tax=Leptomonas pyrrhocoris TaxID=157538 RepID=A0A0M9G2N9_LEPPY|nr:putative ABC transporter [Leptomonas pyrrhocoris]KPA80916.1 putative ABC transporter [Leptomonas pyrrhocoris]|eukprot:XP_015659355.1 putative ABC transporter [Leptomonas pyrrhocoris]
MRSPNASFASFALEAEPHERRRTECHQRSYEAISNEQTSTESWDLHALHGGDLEMRTSPGVMVTANSTGMWTSGGRALLPTPPDRGENSVDKHGDSPISAELARNPYDVCNRPRYRALVHDDAGELSSPDLSSTTSSLARPKQGVFLQQLGHTILRVLILMKREWCSTACELLIPIIFVIGSVALWAIFGTSKGAEGIYFSDSTPSSLQRLFAYAPTAVCASTNVTNTIVGVANCSAAGAAAMNSSIHCPSGRGIPEGLCYYSALLQAAAVIVNSTRQSTSVVLPLDTLIALQWVAMDDSVSVSTPFFYGGKVYFAPDTADVRALVAKMNASSVLFPNVYGGIYATVDAATTYVQKLSSKDPPTWAIVAVNSFTAAKFDVTIMVNQSALPKTTTKLVSMYLGGLDTNTNTPYLFSGYTTLQTFVYDHYITTVLGGTAAKRLSYTAMPTPAYETYSFLTYGPQLAPLILVLGFLYPVSQQTKRIVLEKELRIREAMLIMGLSETTMYLAWMIVYGVWYLLSSVIITVLLRLTYLPHTSAGYIFFMFLFFSWSTITLSGAIAAVFSKARLAALLAPLIYFVMAIPLFAMQSASGAAKTGIMILSPSALSVGFAIVFDHEVAGGTDAKALTYFRDDPKLILVYVFLVLDILLYLLIMAYFDCVIPKEWGTTKNPLFFVIDPIKWCCRRNGADDDDDDAGDLPDGRAEDGVFEETNSAEEAHAAVQIRGLHKKFKRGGKTFLAVNNLYWSLKEGQISVLLGHNGAGKSTTMNLMTGMLEPDGGDCFVYGWSVRHELSKARQEIGLCPQHNILWPTLTVREHLDYYAAIKGLRGEEKEDAIQRLLAAVDLKDKEFYTSKALSGGQKRKLSVGVAFVGGSRLVFLDEPTAGMDVGARRHTWGLLKEMAKYHTILLTTHFMDEADLLGDTVAIMSNGRLQCAGSNVFLKSQLGVGFVLTMSVAPHTRRNVVDRLVRRFVADAETVGSGAGEFAYRLPMASKSTFPDLLAAVENGIPRLGINAYSLSATTLEEVFLKIAEGHAADESSQEEVIEEEEKAAATSAVWNVELETKSMVRWWLQFRAMMVKRFWNALRDRRTQFFQIVCPVACVLLAMLLTLVKLFEFPDMSLTSNVYGATVDVPLANCVGVLDTTTPFSSNVNLDLWSGTYNGATFSSKLRETYDAHTNERYGGVVCAATAADMYHRVFYNTTANHELAIETANVFAGYVRQLTGSSAVEMRTVVAGLPKSAQDEAVQSSIYAMMIAIIIMIPFTFIPSTFVGWIVKERECKARHLQNVSGLSFYVYWFSNFLFDLCCYIITILLVIAVFGIFHRTEYIGAQNIGATFIIFLMYGVSGILMAYAVSFLFHNHSTAQNVVMLANFIVGFLLVLAVSALMMMTKTEKVAKVLRWIFRVVPSYCVGEGISNLASLKVKRAYGLSASAWDMDVVGWVCMYMALEIPFFLFVTLFIDHPGRRQRSQRLLHNPDAAPEEISDEDEDVIAERHDIFENPEREADLVRVEALRKVYSNGKAAVRNVTFGVRPGEVFGFLGTNGAGKTTTISILCQEFYPTGGRAYICGNDIVTDSVEALRCIGYCPQFDACLDLLTVEEHLYLYAGVRGISSRTRDVVVAGLLKLCGLTEYRKTKSHALSGGNRRKLSVAVSLMGGPRVVFFDEPSAGMDPVARRGLWNAIETVADNCSVVLTTHHLEEVEALAHRVAIMVDGALRCIGDKTHLKQKYGTGFEVTVVVKEEEPAVMAGIKQYFAEAFPTSELSEVRAGRFTFELPNTVKLSSVFTSLEERKDALRIRDYNVSQTSIEQVFMRISEEAEQRQEEEHRLEMERREKSTCCGGGCCGRVD